VAPFDPKEKIIEFMVEQREVELSGMTCRDFADELSTDSPAPGGGSAAALMASLGASLDAMVANLSVKKRKCREHWDLMREIAPRAQAIKDNLLDAIDDDTAAFNAWMDTARAGGDVQEAIRRAVEVPLRVLGQCPEIVDLASELEEKGLQASVSDAGVAAAAARAAGVSAFYNVLINLGDLEDQDYVNETRARAEGYLEETMARADSIFDRVNEKLKGKMEKDSWEE
jgi:glutamate formiminotransferase/formiminotetrahydrofolate cyclodeaminase